MTPPTLTVGSALRARGSPGSAPWVAPWAPGVSKSSVYELDLFGWTINAYEGAVVTTVA
jgi:hypothetical protein